MICCLFWTEKEVPSLRKSAPGRKSLLLRNEQSPVPGWVQYVQDTSKSQAAKIHLAWGQVAFGGHACLGAPLHSSGIRPYVIFLAKREVPRPPDSSEVVSEVFQGRVDNIRNGIAFVTLISKEEDTLFARWPEKDLANASIGKSDLFELTMTDEGGRITNLFRKIARRRLSQKLWKDVEELRDAYAHLLDNQDDDH